MANHKSAIKRIAQSEKKRLRNRITKTRVKNAVKKIHAAEKAGENTANYLQDAQSLIDKAAKKGVIHKNTAARRISRLVVRFNQASA